MRKPVAILFDMGGVLQPAVDEWDAATFPRAFPEGLPEDAPLDWFLGMSGECLDTYLALAPPRPAMDVRPIIRQWLVRRGLEPAPGLVERWYDVLCHWEPAPLYEFVAPTLTTLHARGYRLGVVSNTLMPGKYMRENFRKAGVLDFFEALVFSAEVGVNKPSPAIFQHALDQMGLTGEQAWFVGDKPQRDVRGAHAAGMTAVLVDSHHADQPPRGPADVPDLRIKTIADLPALLANLR